MRIEELFKIMFRSFFVITTGITASMFVFCLIFYPDVKFTLDDIGRILLMALACDLPYFIYYSRRELKKKQMLVRTAIHLLLLIAVLLYLAHIWDWVSMSRPIEVTVFILLVMCVYIIVFVVTSYQDKKLANKLNDRLKERYHS